MVQSKSKKKTTKKRVVARKRGARRTITPKKYTPAQLRKMDRMALAQCKDTTIALVLGADVKTFQAEFSKRMAKKRAEGKAIVLQVQYEAASRRYGRTGDRVWWGKQHLGQSDKQAIEHGASDSLSELMLELDGTRHYPGAGESDTGAG